MRLLEMVKHAIDAWNSTCYLCCILYVYTFLPQYLCKHLYFVYDTCAYVSADNTVVNHWMAIVITSEITIFSFVHYENVAEYSPQDVLILDKNAPKSFGGRAPLR